MGCAGDLELSLAMLHRNGPALNLGTGAAFDDGSGRLTLGIRGVNVKNSRPNEPLVRTTLVARRGWNKGFVACLNVDDHELAAIRIKPKLI